jgi:hypothetical protein
MGNGTDGRLGPDISRLQIGQYTTSGIGPAP